MKSVLWLGRFGKFEGMLTRTAKSKSASRPPERVPLISCDCRSQRLLVTSRCKLRTVVKKLLHANPGASLKSWAEKEGQREDKPQEEHPEECKAKRLQGWDERPSSSFVGELVLWPEGMLEQLLASGWSPDPGLCLFNDWLARVCTYPCFCMCSVRVEGGSQLKACRS